MSFFQRLGTVRPAGVLLLGWSATAAGHAPHVHGEARLEVVLDAQVLVIALQSPLDNLVGFEHAPRNNAQRAAWENMLATLRQPASLFAPSAAAICTPEEINLSSPAIEQAVTTAGGEGEGEGDGHDHSHDHDHDHDQGHHHADLFAEYVFRCEHPELLDAIDVNLFVPFARMQRINAEVAMPDGQSAHRLNARNMRLPLR